MHSFVKATTESEQIPEGGNFLHIDVDLKPLRRLQDRSCQLKERSLRVKMLSKGTLVVTHTLYSHLSLLIMPSSAAPERVYVLTVVLFLINWLAQNGAF